MPTLSNEALTSMLKSIPDPKLRKQLADIATSRIKENIYCLSEDCNGRHIGYIYASGNIIPVKDAEGKYWLRSSRPRLDGYTGFECWCGNDSRLAEVERGAFDTQGNPPTKEGIEEVYGKLQSHPTKVLEKDGGKIVDNFMIKPI